MANVQKLVYIDKNFADSKTWRQTNDGDSGNTRTWDNINNQYYRSLVFTNDGHLLTHGLDFYAISKLYRGLLYNSSNGVTSVATNNADGKDYIPYFTTASSGNTSAVSWLDKSTLLTTSWTGSSLITTVGTITTGTWNGSVIDVAHGGTGTNTLTSNQVLIGNGTNAVSTKAIDNAVQRIRRKLARNPNLGDISIS